MYVMWYVVYLVGVLQPTLQKCLEEVSLGGISVTWHESQTANNIESDPMCYNRETLITRNCSGSKWKPALPELKPCLKVVKYFDLTSCPPGYHRITENNNDYCYQLGKPSPWDYPCFASGGASVITDLSKDEVEHLLNSLKATNTSKYFWLPALRSRNFLPLVWTIPGPNWGERVISNNHLRLSNHVTKNCLLLDIENSILLTDVCTKSYPSLCFYINDLHYPAKCPKGYNSFRFSPHNGACYGIEKSDKPEGLSFNEFRNSKCNKPMSDNNDLSRFIFKKIAQLNELPNDVWCWFMKSNYYNSIQIVNASDAHFEGTINNAGNVDLKDYNISLPCMACEAEVIYGETELMFEYNDVQKLIYLTIYYPSGLWKYDENDKGIQCFSDAKGFVRVVDINDQPLIEIKPSQNDSEFMQVEKIVYVIDLLTDTSAQYWCEGHTVNFSLIATDKMVVNPRGSKIHVFPLFIKYYVSAEEVENMTNLSIVVDNVSTLFDAKKVLLMDISNYTSNNIILIVLHLHIAIEDVYQDKMLNLLATFNSLKRTAEVDLSKYFNYTFVNISSSVYCFPTTSADIINLNWGMTSIGQISAPKQFCLQSNGLPVKRRCEGSYLFGGRWGEVEGHCDNTYVPSEATTLLYKFVTRSDEWLNVSRFLTEGLSFVLSDTDTIIPADIYYLSMSLQQVSGIAQENFTSLETAEIEQIAWIMDRVTVLDCDYLRLAQTLNSTNVIVDSINDIIDIVAQRNLNETSELSNVAHQIAVKPQFIVQISYPICNNITGIAVINHFASNNFTDMSIYPLYKNTTLEEVLSLDNLEIATWIPTKLLDSLQSLNNSNDSTIPHMRVIISIYHNDAVFQELQNKNHLINSRVIGISIPEYVSNLAYPIPIVFKQIDHSTNTFCGYWDFQPQQVTHIPGSWKKEGCFKVMSNNEVIVCECFHLTHFGQLFYKDDKDSLNTGHSTALNVITLTGSFLSLLGIAGIWITALIFGNWRKKAGTKVLLQLSTAIALPLVFIVIFNLDYSMFVKENGQYTIATDMEVPCIVLGALLHFSILASFMWMLITAVLQFVRYVRVLGVQRPVRFMFKFTLIGWGIPLIPVIITLALNSRNYIPETSTMRNICYPNGNYLIASVLVPIGIILLVNIILFILVLRAISRGNQRTKTTDMDLVGAQLRVSIFLFFLLGLTWIFGIFSFSNNLIWSYLFCLTSTLQGFVLFIYFVICDPNTRSLWVTLMKPQFSPNSSRNSITSISSG